MNWLTGFCFLCAATTAISHPSSGIVVNERGELFFVHSGRGLAKLDQTGTLTYVRQCTGGHWLCLDPKGSFSRTQPAHFERVTPEGVRPAIIFADGGAPIAVGRDGNLYYASNWAGGDEHAPGGLTVSRLSPDGKLSHVSPSLKETLAELDEGVTGLAAGPDGLLYVASPSSIFKMKPDGTLAPLARPGALVDCDEDLPPNWRAPGFRGLDVAADGTVYAAATGCRCVVKIASAGKVTRFSNPNGPGIPLAWPGAKATFTCWNGRTRTVAPTTAGVRASGK